MLDSRSPSFVMIEGRQIAYDEVSPFQAKGTILLLTGIASTRFFWYKQLRVFGQEYRTIAFDPRDIGDSDPATRPYRIADLAEDASAILRALSVTKSHIVGISMGGYVALELALRYPELVNRLVLVSTSAGGVRHVWPSPRMLPVFIPRSKLLTEEQKRRGYSWFMAPGYADAHPKEMERVVEIGSIERITKEAYYRQLRACLRHDVSKRLGQIEAATLVIHGENDPVVPVKNGINLARRIPGARLILYPNTGHMVIIERAEEFNRDVLDFLGQSHRFESIPGKGQAHD